jgi:outer membrane protein assembly factor BamA
LFLGFDYHFEETFGFVHQANSSLITNNVIGHKGTRQSALGLVTVYDTRDNVINSHKGQLIEISSYFYNKAIGSTYNFRVLNLTYHQFFKIKRNHILALQTKARFASGDVPFLDLSIVGNDDLLRGYPKNRYRDHNFVGTQVEYRFPLFWRFGMTTFAGVGDVFKKQSDLKFENLKYSVGAGLRFVINPAERLNLRLDYGYGKEGGYFYILVAEAF